MTFDLNIFLLSTVVPVPLWLGTAVLAFYRRRWMLTLGCGLAGINTILTAIIVAHGTLPAAVQTGSAFARIPIVALLVCSFIARQPARAPRPATWTP